METLHIQVLEKDVLRFAADFEGTVELGRQRTAEEKLFAFSRQGDRWRLVIASGNEGGVSRSHVVLEPLADGAARVSNVSASQPIGVDGAANLGPGVQREFVLPILIRFAGKSVRVHPVVERNGVPPGSNILATYRAPRRASSADTSSGMARALSAFGDREETTLSGSIPVLSGITSADISSKTLMQWLHAAVKVLQAAADSEDFFDRAARAIVDLVHLDIGRVLLRRNGSWHSQAVQLPPRLVSAQVTPPSKSILHQVLSEKRTVWIKPISDEDNACKSLADLDAIVAAPMLDRNGEVVGVLYGERQAQGLFPLGGITEVEAMLVELLALGVTVGIARLEQEQAALAERVRFEQFFTPDLARQLAQHTDWLEGREAETTVLFCDIRRFSAISERLGPQRTVEWCRDVLDELSDCVLCHEGVLVDYTGDGLMAMWGAPEPQPDHAARACRAAVDMLGRLPRLNADWTEVLGCPIELGVGINSGLAQVGNTGSRHKFKYGPRGNTVNLASRVEGATKHLKCPALITTATKMQLDATFATRRLARVRMVNIEAPVELHELTTADRRDWSAAREEYERALEFFENQDFVQAARVLGNFREKHPDDAAALVLLHRAVTCMAQGIPSTHPVWVLNEK